MSFGPGTVVLPAGQGTMVPVLGSPYTFKATDPDTRGAYAALEVTQVGAPPPLHVHEQAEEALYVLAGQITAWIGEEELTADAGTLVLVPRGTPHTFAAATAEDTPPRLLVLISPPGPEGFFQVVDAQFPSQVGPPDPAAIGALAASYGIRIVGPPPTGRQ